MGADADHAVDQESSGDGGLGSAGQAPPPPPAPPAGPPEEFIDPISQEVMLDPVMLVETGQSYERATIEAWFQRCQEQGWPCTDPLTRQELRSCTFVPNYSLRSLISGWAQRQHIADLHSFSKQVARLRSTSLGRSAAAAEALAQLRLSPGRSRERGSDGSGMDGRGPLAGSSSSLGDGVSYPAVNTAPVGGPISPPDLAQQAQAQQARSAAPAESFPQRPQHAQHAQQQATPAAAVQVPSAQPGLYPTAQQPLGSTKQHQADAALAALRAAATQGGGANRGAAAYHAWTLQQLAGDAQGRDLLWEGNAIPLTIFLLGQLQRQPGDAALADAAPALCAVLQRMCARDADVASSISQCGGVHALVIHLGAPQPGVRAAACRALYYLGWQGTAIRQAILTALAQHAAACNLPPKPLLAFWRFWEHRASSSADLAAGEAAVALSSAGREAEWEALALFLHMLAEGCCAEVKASACGAAAASALQPLDASSTAVPAVLAHAAAASQDAAVRYAAYEAAVLLSQLPENRMLLAQALLQRAQQAGTSSNGVSSGSAEGSLSSSAVAGNAAWLLWTLCCRPERGASRPAVVRTVAQHGSALLAVLEAALQPQQVVAESSRWTAAGLLACLLFEPAARGDGSAAAAADAVRRLLASPAAAGVLQGLLATLQPGGAAAAPQASQAAAVAVANLAAFRGAAVCAAAAQLAHSGGSAGSGDFKEWLARLGGRRRHSPKASEAQLADEAAEGQPGQHTQQGQGQQGPPAALQPTDPRGALLFHGAMPALLSLLIGSCDAVAAAQAAGRAPAGTAIAAALTPASQQQSAAAVATAAGEAAKQREVLSAALLALNNLCADPAAAGALRACARQTAELQGQLQAALTAAMNDRALPEPARNQARDLLLALSGAPGQRHLATCMVLPPPCPAPAYPNP